MKKYIYILASLLLGLSSCSDRVPVPAPEGEATVTIDMTVSLPQVVTATKATNRASNPQIENIYVAVFGRQGYLNDYALAAPLDASGNVTNTYASTNGQDYKVRVTLLATTSTRYIHIIANGPSQLDYQTQVKDLMLGEALMTSDNKGAYWQHFTLAGTAKLEGGVWVPSDDAADKFSKIRLIRNFARVKVESSSSDFEVEGFKVYRTSKYGSYAMPMDEDGSSFVDADAYIASDYDKVKYPTPVEYIQGELGYKGYVPDAAKALIDTDDPKVGDAFGTDYQFVYESPNTESNYPYIIVAGKYKGAATSYYRIELVDDEGTHIPIYRNLDYTITLSAIAKNGVSDPKNAVTSNGNVSTTAQDLSDISDGISGLFALYTDRTYVIGDDDDPSVTFQYQYIPDLSADKTSDNYYKKAEILEVSGDAIDGDISEGTLTDGWYPVTFNLKKSSQAVEAGKDLVSTFKVRGTSNTGAKLFRVITVRVIRTPNYVANSTGPDGMNFNLGLPGDLPSSMFPIVFSVYDSNQCLNPSGTDMPVTLDTANKQFYYVKTVTLKDYTDNLSEDKSVSTIQLKFKKVKSGTTTVTVKSNYFPDTSGTITVQ